MHNLRQLQRFEIRQASWNTLCPRSKLMIGDSLLIFQSRALNHSTFEKSFVIERFHLKPSAGDTPNGRDVLPPSPQSELPYQQFPVNCTDDFSESLLLNSSRSGLISAPLDTSLQGELNIVQGPGVSPEVWQGYGLSSDPVITATLSLYIQSTRATLSTRVCPFPTFSLLLLILMVFRSQSNKTSVDQGWGAELRCEAED